MGLSDLWLDRPREVNSHPVVGGYANEATKEEIGLGDDQAFDAISVIIRKEAEQAEYERTHGGGYGRKAANRPSPFRMDVSVNDDGSLHVSFGQGSMTIGSMNIDPNEVGELATKCRQAMANQRAKSFQRGGAYYPTLR